MCDSPNEMAVVFIDIFKKILKDHALLKKRKIRSKYTPWLTSDIIKSMEERDKMKKLASKDPKLWPMYRTLRNKVTNTIRLPVNKNYQSLVTKTKNNPKNMWKTIDKILHKTSGKTAISELRDEDVFVKNQIQIIEKLNEHFVNIRPELASKLEMSPNDDPIKYLNSICVNHKFSFKIMSEEAMLTSIMMLKGGKAPGPDVVPTNLVKDAAKSIAKPSDDDIQCLSDKRDCPKCMETC